MIYLIYKRVTKYSSSQSEVDTTSLRNEFKNILVTIFLINYAIRRRVVYSVSLLVVRINYTRLGI